MLFCKKPDVKSEEFEKLYKNIVEIRSEIEILKGKIAIFETTSENLRGILNRKLGGFIKKEQEEESKGLNNPVILPYNGTFK